MLKSVSRIIRAVVGAALVCFGGYYFCLILNFATMYVIAFLKSVGMFLYTNYEAAIIGVVLLMIGAWVFDIFATSVKNRLTKIRKE